MTLVLRIRKDLESTLHFKVQTQQRLTLLQEREGIHKKALKSRVDADCFSEMIVGY
jgi:hypothetical protein